MRGLFAATGWTPRLSGAKFGLATLLPSPSAFVADALQPISHNEPVRILLRGFSS